MKVLKRYNYTALPIAKAEAIELIPSPWVERLVHVAVPAGQPEQSGGSFRHTARCLRTRPPGREGTKAKGETVGK